MSHRHDRHERPVRRLATPSWAPPIGRGPAPEESVPAIAGQLAAERRRAAMLERRVERLRRLLSKTRETLAAARRELAQSSRTEGRDPLTGLPNRRGVEHPMHHMLTQHVGGARRLALLFVDLDGFKAINDRLGHAAGDELLRIVAARLAGAMRRGDLVCRHGGDEFVCLLPNLDSEDRAEALAMGLLHSIAQPCALDGHEVRVQASIGVAIYPRDGDSLPTLLRSADSAMYAAKQRRCGVATAREHAAAAVPATPR